MPNKKASIFSNITSTKLIDDLNEKGVILINTENYQESLKVIDRNNTLAMNNKGVALGGLGKHQEAITWFDKALAVNGTDTDAMNNKGVALDNLGKHQEAITWFDKALAVNGTDTDAMNNKGVALDNLGKHQEPITWFDKALNQTKTAGMDTDIISNKGFVIGVELKEYDIALSLIEKYLKKTPEHKGLLCTIAEIYNETGYQDIANHYKDHLLKLDANYKYGLIAKVSEIEKEAFA
jgi:tetratricopeptide (TPR) repeat protein